MGCGFVFRALVTRANGSFVPSIAPGRLFVYNEIGSFVPPKNFSAVTSAFSSSKYAVVVLQIVTCSKPSAYTQKSIIQRARPCCFQNTTHCGCLSQVDTPRFCFSTTVFTSLPPLSIFDWRQAEVKSATANETHAGSAPAAAQRTTHRSRLAYSLPPTSILSREKSESCDFHLSRRALRP